MVGKASGSSPVEGLPPKTDVKAPTPPTSKEIQGPALKAVGMEPKPTSVPKSRAERIKEHLSSVSSGVKEGVKQIMGVMMGIRATPAAHAKKSDILSTGSGLRIAPENLPPRVGEEAFEKDKQILFAELEKIIPGSSTENLFRALDRCRAEKETKVKSTTIKSEQAIPGIIHHQQMSQIEGSLAKILLPCLDILKQTQGKPMTKELLSTTMKAMEKKLEEGFSTTVNYQVSGPKQDQILWIIQQSLSFLKTQRPVPPKVQVGQPEPGKAPPVPPRRPARPTDEQLGRPTAEGSKKTAMSSVKDTMADLFAALGISEETPLPEVPKKPIELAPSDELEAMRKELDALISPQEQVEKKEEVISPAPTAQESTTSVDALWEELRSSLEGSASPPAPAPKIQSGRPLPQPPLKKTSPPQAKAQSKPSGRPLPQPKPRQPISSTAAPSVASAPQDTAQTEAKKVVGESALGKALGTDDLAGALKVIKEPAINVDLKVKERLGKFTSLQFRPRPGGSSLTRASLQATVEAMRNDPGKLNDLKDLVRILSDEKSLCDEIKTKYLKGKEEDSKTEAKKKATEAKLAREAKAAETKAKAPGSQEETSSEEDELGWGD
jgi:hypothetical protein